MTEKIFVQGNDAIGWGATAAGCTAFFGYPITPQNEVPEWFSRELPKRGGVYVQSQSEIASLTMVYGAACAGARAMTSTSGPGWSLMLEMLSGVAAAEIPCVIALVQRAGPGAGPIRHAQQDYLSVTWGGGHGGYKVIALAPASIQETVDLMQLAFYLADKWRTPVVLLSDGVLGLLAEPVEVKTLEFGPLPEKDWAIRSRRKQKDGIARGIIHAKAVAGPGYKEGMQYLNEKYNKIKESEVRYELYQADDAELCLVAYGYVARSCQEAVDMARAEGLKVGLIRPISLWPFPYDVIREKANSGCKIVVAEDSLGQMVEDVRLAVEGRTQVHLIDMLSRHLSSDAGLIMPDTVLAEVKKIL